MRYYLDTAPIIYDVENTAPFAAAVNAKLSLAGLVLVTSELTRLECRVKPLRAGNQTLLADFDNYLLHTIA